MQNENPRWEIEFGIPFYLYSHAANILESLSSAGSIIAQLDHGYYEITVVNDDTSAKEEHITSLGNDTVFPACTCGEWKRNAVPCWHMFTVFKNSAYVKYDSMSALYRSNALFGLDYSCLTEEDLPKTKNVFVQTQNSIPREDINNQSSSHQMANKIVETATASSTAIEASPVSSSNTVVKRHSKYSKLIADLKEKHVPKGMKRKEEKIVRIVDDTSSCDNFSEAVSPAKKSYQGNMKLRERRLVSKTKRGWVAGTSVVGANLKFPTLRTVKVKSIADVLAEMPDDVVEQLKKKHLKQPLVEKKSDKLNNTNNDSNDNRINNTKQSENFTDNINHPQHGLNKNNRSQNINKSRQTILELSPDKAVVTQASNKITSPTTTSSLSSNTIDTNATHSIKTKTSDSPKTDPISLSSSDTSADVSHKNTQHELISKTDNELDNESHMNKNSTSPLSLVSDDDAAITSTSTAHDEHEQSNHIILKLLQDDEASSIVSTTTNTQISTDNHDDHVVMTPIVQAQETGNHEDHHDHEQNFHLLTIATKRKADDGEYSDEEEEKEEDSSLSVKKMK